MYAGTQEKPAEWRKEYDEIYAFQGIGKYDLKNCVRTADYIECIKKFNEELYHTIYEGSNL